MSEKIIEAKNIQKSFGENTLFESIDLEVEKNEIALLMGPNGVGKTILLCLLAGGLTRDNGEITIAGSTNDCQHNVSILLQDAMSIPDLTGAQNIKFYQQIQQASTDDWKDHIERFDIEDELDKEVRHYSGGMQRKLELAVTLSVDVPCYLLDEPTAGLDLSMIREFHNMLLKQKERGKTFLITSHTPLDIQIADRIFFVNDGRVINSGTKEELRDGVPQVLRVRGDIGVVLDEVRNICIGNQTFERGDELRGFVTPERAAELDSFDESVESSVEEPSLTDLFNYYAHLAHLHDDTASHEEDKREVVNGA